MSRLTGRPPTKRVPLVVGMKAGQVLVAARIYLQQRIARIRLPFKGDFEQEGTMRRYHLLI
jgi:hypothetical protein